MKPPTQPIVFVDVDDTIADTGRHVLQHINQGSGPSYVYDKLTLDFREGNREGKAYNDAVLQLLRPEIMIETAPLAGALAAMERLHNAGYAVHIVSARQEPLHQTTEQWLQKHGFADFVDEIHPRPSRLKGKAFKRELAEQLKPVALFDDTLDVTLELAAAVATVFLIHKPWNKDTDLVLPANVVRSADFAAAVDTFLAK